MRIETERLTIEEIKESDIETLHKLVSDPSVYEFMQWGPNTIKDTQNFVQMAVSQQSEEKRKSFEMKVLDKKTGEYVGAVGIRVKSEAHKVADMGYWIRKERRGEGLATEASVAIIKFGFDTLGMNKVWAVARPENIGSLRVLEKCGMSKEGYLKDDQRVRGKFVDSVLMAVLKREFTENE